MGYFSNVDSDILEMVAAKMDDEAVVLAMNLLYNGIVSESRIRESLETIHCRNWRSVERQASKDTNTQGRG